MILTLDNIFQNGFWGVNFFDITFDFDVGFFKIIFGSETFSCFWV